MAEPAAAEKELVGELSPPPAVTPELPASELPAVVPSVVSKLAVTERERVTTYLDGRLRARARKAHQATSHLEGDKSWSDLVRRAILAKVARRESTHNNGRPYAGDETPLSPGRPLKKSGPGPHSPQGVTTVDEGCLGGTSSSIHPSKIRSH